jgi:mRNA-degrading endonuclease RelE of RelBE toxin-antitoxin system
MNMKGKFRVEFLEEADRFLSKLDEKTREKCFIIFGKPA